MESKNYLKIEHPKPADEEYQRLADGTIQCFQNGEWQTLYWERWSILPYIFDRPEAGGTFVEWLRRTPGLIKLETAPGGSSGCYPKKVMLVEIISYVEE
jgi:hypothetical protein